MHHKWENALTLDSQSWGYRTNMGDIKSIGELIEEVVSTVSCGGKINKIINRFLVQLKNISKCSLTTHLGVEMAEQSDLKLCSRIITKE